MRWRRLISPWGVGVAQLVERRAQDSMTSVTRVRTPSGAQEKCEFFRVKNVGLTRYRCAQPPSCIRTHKNDHICTLKILQSMSEFGGLRKHERNQHLLVGLGSAALAAALVFTQVRRPECPERDNSVNKNLKHLECIVLP